MVWAVLGLQNIDFHMAGDVEAHSHATVRAARGRSSGHWRLPCPRGCQPMGWPRAILRSITLISFSHCLVLRIWSVMLSSPSLVYMSHPHRDLLFMLQPPPLQTVTQICATKIDQSRNMMTPSHSPTEAIHLRRNTMKHC